MTNEEFQKLVLSELKTIRQEMATKDDLSKLNQRLENVEGQMCETNDIVKALMHRTEELDAKFDGLLTTTATKDAVSKLDTKLDRLAADVTFLVRKAAEHEDDIRNLKLIK